LATKYGIETYEYDFEADIRVTTEECYGSYTRIEKRTITTDLLLYEKFVSADGLWHEESYIWHDGNSYTEMYSCDEYTQTYEYDFENDIVIINVTLKSGEQYSYKQIISTGETIE